MSEYTPDVERIKFAYVDRRGFEAHIINDYEVTDERAEAEFDRWLAARDRAIKAEAWQEGHAATLTYVGIQFMPIFNPYRSDQ